MKKKFLSITMGTVLLLSTVLTGCGGNGGSGDSLAPADQPAANTAETTAAPAEPAGDTAAADAANATDSASDGEKVHLKWAAWDISLITYWNDLANKYMEPKIPA